MATYAPLPDQSQYDADFSERMFTYSLRIFDRFRKVPVSLAMLCDDNDNWRPHEYVINYLDTKLHFDFGMVKLLDFREQWADLEISQNPFATVVMAHLKSLESRPDSFQRKTWKLNLIRALYDKGFLRQDIINLYRFIGWSMILSEDLELQCWSELTAFEEERKVTYVTTGERIGFERGKSEGKLEGELSLVFRLLSRRFGSILSNTQAQIQALSLPQIEALGEALLDFSAPDDSTHWLQENQA